MTRAGETHESQLRHSRGDTETKRDRSRASKWDNDQLEGYKVLVDPHNETTKGGHTHPRPPPTSDRPWYLWDTLLSFLFLGGTSQTKEKSQEQNLHLASLVASLLPRLRASQGLERM